MAGSEVYRVEIPIIIDDQSEAPLTKARERVSKFEQAAQKTNQRIQRMAMTDYKLRLSVLDRAMPAINKVGRTLRTMTARAWTFTVGVKDRITGFLGRIGRLLTSPLALLGAGAGAGAAIYFPLKLAGEMEQAGIAMEFFTESAAKGQAFMDRLQTFAAKTPFEFPDVRDAAVGLMPLYKNMYGVDKAMEETMRTITAFGDAAGLTGAGIQGMNLAMLGFRQIGTMGKLSMEELRQVTENLMIPMDIILKELGLTGEALENLASQGIDSKTAMEGIIRALEKNFAGGMDKMSKSLLGLTSTIKDTASLTVWHFGAGMAEPVRRILLDITGMTDDTGGAFEEFQRKLEQVGRRIGRKFEQMYEGAKRFFRDLTNTPGFDKMTWGEKASVALDKILSEVNMWLEGPGGETIKKTGGTLGTFLKTGMEEVIPEITPVAIELGKTLGGAVVEGIYEAIKASPWAGILLGAYVGFQLGGPKGAAIGAGIGAATWGIPKGFEALGKHIPGTEHYTRERIAEYERAEQMLKERRATTPAGEPLYSGTSLAPMPKRAIGGIYSRPHTALVAEAGPEAIIPLTGRMRNRGIGLWEETGRRLGIPTPLAVGVGGLGATAITAGPVSVTFNISASDGQDVLQTIRANYKTIADEITDTIADGLKGAYNNMPWKN